MYVPRAAKAGAGEGDRAGEAQGEPVPATAGGVPDDDIVVMHKLMIEADEETYLQTANTFTPTNSGTLAE
jgi:hypothetical protein